MLEHFQYKKTREMKPEERFLVMSLYQEEELWKQKQIPTAHGGILRWERLSEMKTEKKTSYSVIGRW